MSFFEGLISADPTEEPQPPNEPSLPAYEAPHDEPLPPERWFIPARLPHTAELGAGPDTRLMLSGWHVWPRSVTIRVEIFRRRLAEPNSPRRAVRSAAGALRCGMLLGDGRKVTTLDPAPTTATNGSTGPSLRLEGGGDGFHEHLVLHLSQLPPEGPLELVVEWPDEDIPETRTTFDGTAVRAAGAEAVPIWPEAELFATPSPNGAARAAS
ncbi:hypothetical protein H8N01_19695 [Streptomyces sp. AC536]|uniref:hypothetical protein n=1 Tax=Streptomyces buecherae TaxID=2763006 RepID=UPI00164D8FC6|nr:hypothetical protein [Streptomyces buecherae]MBC3984730.1 hypothetical protein [Streptomyces buecherae]QNJ40967.1 hypothetical protein H7H31_14935 [Streptomyces buecherae]